MTLRDYVLVEFARAWQEEQGAARVDPGVVAAVHADPRFAAAPADAQLLLYAETLIALRLDHGDGLPNAAALRGAIGVASVVVPLLGLLAGAALLQAALPPPELRPVSVFQFLAEGVVLPAVFLLWTLLITNLLRARLARLHWVAWLLGLLRGRAGRSELGRLSGRVLQRSGVAGSYFARASHQFWIASLLVFLLLGFWRFAFTDYLFSWSSTLPFTGEQVERMFASLAAPLDWIPGIDAPSAEQVRLSEFGSLGLDGTTGGSYVESSGDLLRDQTLRKGWYAVLLAIVAFWGLLPRLAALALAGRGVARGIRDGLDDATSRLILAALAPELASAGAEPSSPPLPRAQHPTPGPRKDRAGRGLDLLVFATEAPDPSLLDRLGLSRLGLSGTTARIATDDDDDAMDACVAHLAGAQGPEGAIVTFDVADIPDGLKAEFLGRVAAALGRDAPLHVLLRGVPAFVNSPRGRNLPGRLEAWGGLLDDVELPRERLHVEPAPGTLP